MIAISRHAVDKYRARVVLCCERKRSDRVLREAMQRQISQGTWKCVGGETFVIECGPLIPKPKKSWDFKVAHVTHQFVIECQTVVTVLGFMMRSNKRMIQRRRRRQRVARLMMARQSP